MFALLRRKRVQMQQGIRHVRCYQTYFDMTKEVSKVTESQFATSNLQHLMLTELNLQHWNTEMLRGRKTGASMDTAMLI